MECRAAGQEPENRAGAGGQHQAPDQRHHPSRLGVAVLSPHQHGPEIDADHGHEAAIEQHVPGKDRRRVLVQHGDDQPIRPAEVEHQHRETTSQQCNRQQPRERRQRLVFAASEDRRNGRDVQRAGGGKDEKNRAHMRQSPHDMVGHAGDVVALRLHGPGGREPKHQRQQKQAQHRHGARRRRDQRDT